MRVVLGERGAGVGQGVGKGPTEVAVLFAGPAVHAQRRRLGSHCGWQASCAPFAQYGGDHARNSGFSAGSRGNWTGGAAQARAQHASR